MQAVKTMNPRHPNEPVCLSPKMQELWKAAVYKHLEIPSIPLGHRGTKKHEGSLVCIKISERSELDFHDDHSISPGRAMGTMVG